MVAWAAAIAPRPRPPAQVPAPWAAWVWAAAWAAPARPVWVISRHDNPRHRQAVEARPASHAANPPSMWNSINDTTVEVAASMLRRGPHLPSPSPNPSLSLNPSPSPNLHHLFRNPPSLNRAPDPRRCPRRCPPRPSPNPSRVCRMYLAPSPRRRRDRTAPHAANRRPMWSNTNAITATTAISTSERESPTGKHAGKQAGRRASRQAAKFIRGRPYWVHSYTRLGVACPRSESK